MYNLHLAVFPIPVGVSVGGGVNGLSGSPEWRSPLHRTSRFQISPQEPVSLLVPTCGLDEGAWENWSSLYQQNYPNYEVLFGVVDPADPAVPTLRQLVATYPQQARLLVGLHPPGINHKDSTLTYLLDASRHEIVIFADSDIQVSPDYVQTVMAPLVDPTVGLVTCAYVAHQPQFVAAALASLGRCCDFIPSVLVAQCLDQGLRFAIGVTMATRRKTLAAVGGLHLNRIGSDYNLGKRIAAAGYRVELAPAILESDTGRERVRNLFARELRWARTIRFNRGPIYYSMVFCYGPIYCLLLLVLSGFQGWAIALTLATFLLRYGEALVAIYRLNCPRLVRWLWLLPLRDGLSWLVWLGGAFGRTVSWQGRRLTIEGDWQVSMHVRQWLNYPQVYTPLQPLNVAE